ncbi:hypothetical protein E2C01_024297 [Portunus trituberculatus]|uniref:Uncharacterized protein n=1 Tax=Portunus trituberculatus TaxID=210409 RepID=A0A5B7EDG4_PORTR|nr:hypothetical protein [Portunus trituberculatus]
MHTALNQIGKQLHGLPVYLSVNNIDEVRGSTKVLQINVVDVADEGKGVILGVLYRQDALDDLTLPRWLDGLVGALLELALETQAFVKV